MLALCLKFFTLWTKREQTNSFLWLTGDLDLILAKVISEIERTLKLPLKHPGGAANWLTGDLDLSIETGDLDLSIDSLVT